ncbi:transcription factor subunit med10 of mediator complex domain-containing protein [Ditylenchus destructor]|nr:transcription factor subunit med10 of mediator complex domain-containing protein [Ditylenchus destructor]
MSDRYMPSIFSECDKFKQAYDKCFTNFFQQYIHPDYNHKAAQNPCEHLHTIYRECLEKNLAEHRPYEIDLEELRKEVLFTEKDRLQKEQESNSNADQSTEARFNLLERTLEQFQENARHMGVIASDFTPRSQEPLNQKVHTMISGLQELDVLKNQFTDVRVPIELLDYLDQGKNPQLYTRECLERTKQKNKEVNGKIEMYKKFRAMLLNELSQEMPADAMSYISHRKDPRNAPKSNNPTENP